MNAQNKDEVALLAFPVPRTVPAARQADVDSTRESYLNLPAPKPMLVAHEPTAVEMAHRHAMVSGRAQAVMVHVVVGLANALCVIINAARGNVPMLMTAGRPPITEAGTLGC